jgi:L-rhamnose mutarotase
MRAFWPGKIYGGTKHRPFRLSNLGDQMQRLAFRLRIKAGKEEEYEAAHKNVWPALLAKLKEVGISKYSIFRREQDLFLVMQVDDFDAAWRALDQDSTNLKWQEEMALLFEPVPGLKPGEKFAMMKEVFYLD